MEINGQEQADNWKKGLRISFTVFALSFLYAFVRYNIVRGVPYEQIPLYITNKVFALSSAIIIGLSFIIGALCKFWPETFSSKLSLRKPLGLAGFGMAALHSLISLAILSPANYPKFFDAAGKMNFIGQTSLLFGILAFSVFFIVAIFSVPAVEERVKPEQWKSIQRLGYLAYLFVLLHVAVMGFRGWSDPAGYQYWLIPISLLASLFMILVFLFRGLAAAVGSKN